MHYFYDLADRAEIEELKSRIEELLQDINEDTDMNGLFKVLAKLRRDLGEKLRLGTEIFGGNYIFDVTVNQDPNHLNNGVRGGSLTLLVPIFTRIQRMLKPNTQLLESREYNHIVF
jgi:hypothetical protein